MVASSGDEAVAKIATTVDEVAATAASNRWLGRDGGAAAGASAGAKAAAAGKVTAARRDFIVGCVGPPPPSGAMHDVASGTATSPRRSPRAASDAARRVGVGAARSAARHGFAKWPWR